MSRAIPGQFYVYVHRRLRSGVPFYVGKGQRGRAYDHGNRNVHWRRIVAKESGRKVDFLIKGVDEDLAFFIEQEAISLFKARGHKLANLTDGGEGCAGMVMSEQSKEKIASMKRGLRASVETRRKMSIAASGKIRTPEHSANLSIALTGKKLSIQAREKISAAHLGMKRGPLSAETRAKISASNKGRKITDEWRARISLANIGKSMSLKTKRKISSALKGRVLSDERRAQMREVWERRRLCASAL